MGQWCAGGLIVLLGTVALPWSVFAQVDSPIEADRPPPSPRPARSAGEPPPPSKKSAPSRPARLPGIRRPAPVAARRPPPAPPLTAEARFVHAVLEALDRGRLLDAALSEEFLDEVRNELAAGPVALLAPGSLGRLATGRWRPDQYYNYEVERTLPGGRSTLLHLRLVPVQNRWQIDGLAPADLADPRLLAFRRDNRLPVVGNRLFNAARLAALPPLGPQRMAEAVQLLTTLYFELNRPERDPGELLPLLSPRFAATLRSLDQLLIPGNLGRFETQIDPAGRPLVNLRLLDGQGNTWIGAAYFADIEGRLVVDALGYFGPSPGARLP